MSNIAPVSPPTCLTDKARIIDQYILKYLPDENQYPQVLHEAIRYAIMAGGKRLRPVLGLMAYESCGGKGEEIFKAAVAIELIHTYSLIHDDLPCMDDDDLRRGKPTLHKKYDEAIALLAGDALHDFAFRLMAETGHAEIILELAVAIGTTGMLAGQMADLEAEGRSLNIEDIKYIHDHKTGKLIRGSVRIGAILAGADDEVLNAITCYGEKIGLAFQIIDDILDINGEEEMLGKPIGSDYKNKKATYPAILGLKKSQEIAGNLIDEAVDIIKSGISDCDNFIQMAHFIASRRY